MLVSSIGSVFAHFVNKGNFGQIWIKILDWSIRVENCHFGTCLTNYGVPFLYIYKKLYKKLKRSIKKRQQFYGEEFKVRPFLKNKGSQWNQYYIEHLYSLFLVLPSNGDFFDKFLWLLSETRNAFPLFSVY